MDGAVPPASVTLDHNLVYGPGRYDPVYGTAYIVGDPMFVYPANGNFHLKSGSPAIDAGSPYSVPSTDYEGKPRRGAPDIGALET